MEQDFDAELQRLVAQEDMARRIQRDFDQTAGRLRSFLESKGINFGPPADGSTPAEYGVIEENRRKLRDIATLVAAHLAIAAYGGESRPRNPLYKKKLQAALIYYGFDEPWFELIDHELPGDPLNEDDTDILTSVAMEKMLQDEEAAVQLQHILTQMVDYLGEQGISELSEEDRVLLERLAVIQMRTELHNISGLKLENIRGRLITLGYDDPAWLSLVQTFFNPPE